MERYQKSLGRYLPYSSYNVKETSWRVQFLADFWCLDQSVSPGATLALLIAETSLFLTHCFAYSWGAFPPFFLPARFHSVLHPTRPQYVLQKLFFKRPFHWFHPLSRTIVFLIHPIILLQDPVNVLTGWTKRLQLLPTRIFVIPMLDSYSAWRWWCSCVDNMIENCPEKEMGSVLTGKHHLHTKR